MKKQLLEKNNLVSCQVGRRQMQYLRCGNFNNYGETAGKTEMTAYDPVFIDLESSISLDIHEGEESA